MFRQRLPKDQYRFVELVERGRPDWLASACSQGVRCDLLVISGHFDGVTEFYSDQVAASEYLPVAEMERASCSESCPGLFSQLKEVYLFGCNTLNADAVKSASSEVGRSLIRAGHSPADARRLTRTLDQLHAESSRDRMRRIFTNVPVIYGFSSVAPLGPHAATLLGRYLQPSAIAEVGSGRTNSRLLGAFASESMIAVSGFARFGPARAVHRRDVCQFIDDRLSPADKLVFIHGLLRRDMAEVRMFLERIEGLFASLTPAERQDPAFSAALAKIARRHGRAGSLHALRRRCRSPRDPRADDPARGEPRLAVAGRDACRADAHDRRAHRPRRGRRVGSRHDLRAQQGPRARRRARPPVGAAGGGKPGRHGRGRRRASEAPTAARGSCRR